MNSAVSNLRLHYSSMLNIMAFKTLDEGGFLEFSVSNAKYLAFDTLDGNTLIRRKESGSHMNKKIYI